MKESPDQSPIPEGFSRYDTADYLNSEEDIAAYIEAAEEVDDPVLMADARKIEAIARERLANPLQGIKVTFDDL